jgi:hypothetical protein
MYAVLRLGIYVDSEDDLNLKAEQLEEAGYRVFIESIDDKGEPGDA